MSEREQLEQAIVALEAQRAALGDVAVDAAIAGLRQKLAALEQSQTSPIQEGERRFVTVMFADISGFTAMSERMDPEQARDLINGCFGQLVPVVNKYGGTVSRFLGDAIMALFGAPVAHENDPERALRAALEMMDVLVAFNAERGADLGMHIGINTGLTVAGALGTSEQYEYSVMGDAVNLASRLEDVSERGEILVGADTYRLTAPLFEFEALPPIQLKGKAELVSIYRLLAAKPKPGRVRGLEARGISSPLVGRDAEFAMICRCVERLLEGQGGIVTIIGEAGVGKSRLMAEIRDAVVGTGTCSTHLPTYPSTNLPVQWLEGRSLSFGQTIGYWPFQEIVRNYVGISEEDGEHTAWVKLERRVRALFPDRVAEVLPYLASLLALEVREPFDERVKYLDGEAMRRRIFLAARWFFERLAWEQPLVLVFEDIHWIDQSSAELLEHLTPLVEQVPLLICGVSRPYRHAFAASLQKVAVRDYAGRYTEIILDPLSVSDSAQLLHNLLEISDLSPRWREMVLGKAEGSPFFIEEVLRSLIDVGAIVRDTATGRWRATVQVEEVAIPDTIQGILVARVDRLEEGVKRVLRMASVIGRSFLYRVLRAVAEADRQLDEHLAELQATELVREKRRVPELEYIFKHVLAQETVYESVLLQRRRELHARVGECVETLFASRLEGFYGLLAYHYARAEMWEKAQEYLFKAGDQAGRVAADAEALAHYRQALAACTRAFGDAWNPVQRAALERRMGEALFRRGEHAHARDYLGQALAHLGRFLPVSRWGVRLAIVLEAVWQAGHRLLPSRFLEPLAGPVDPAMEEQVRVYELVIWMESNPERYGLAALRALNVAERGGFPYGVAAGSIALGDAIGSIPIFWLAETYLRRALMLAEQIQHAGTLGVASYGLARHKAYLCDWNAVADLCQRAARIYDETGDLRRWGFAKHLLAVALRYQGVFAQALVQCQDLVRLGRDGDDSQLLCMGLFGQGSDQRRLGRLDEAAAALQAAVELARSIPDHTMQAASSGELGRCYLRQDQLERALSVLEEGQRVCVEHNIGWGNSMPLYNALAEAYLWAAEQSDDAERGDWLEKTERIYRAMMKQGRAFRRGLPELMLLRGRCDWLRGRPTAARRRWQRGLALAERQDQRYDEGMIYLEMGRRSGERAHLERAEAIFAEVGAEWDLARARELLGREGA